MGRKSKESSVNLYYLKNQNEKRDKSVSKTKSKTKKNITKSNKTNKLKANEDKFNFDDEIVIGVTKVKDNKKSQNKEKQKIVKSKKENYSRPKKVQASKKKINNKKEKKIRNFKIFKYIFILSALLAAIICFMLSPIFNIKEIKVSGNTNISAEQIISFSEIKIGENTYKINKISVINKINKNAYIENVKIKRKLPSILEIEIKERQPTYMLEYANSYAYINNQGYMLEITDEKIDKPIITGIITSTDSIKPGNRLTEEDLLKLEDVLKIMESATSNEIERLITKVDISDKSNYILHMETEGKTVKLGDISDISTKMLHVKAILERNEGIEGEIIVNSVSQNSKSRFIQKIN